MRFLRKFLLLFLLTEVRAEATLPASPVAELCLRDLKATQVELADLKSLDQDFADYTKLIKSQRDDALKQLEKVSSPLPWYLWAAVGAATAAFVIKGVRN